MFFGLLQDFPSARTTTQASLPGGALGWTASWPVTSGCWHSKTFGWAAPAGEVDRVRSASSANAARAAAARAVLRGVMWLFMATTLDLLSGRRTYIPAHAEPLARRRTAPSPSGLDRPRRHRRGADRADEHPLP